MNSLSPLKNQELELIRKHREDSFSSEKEFQAAIENLLASIASNQGNIRTYEDWDWATNAIIRWDSLLRSRFGTTKGLRLPRLLDLAGRETLEGVVEQTEPETKDIELVGKEMESLEQIVREMKDQIIQEIVAQEKQSKERHAVLERYVLSTATEQTSAQALPSDAIAGKYSQRSSFSDTRYFKETMKKGSGS